MRDLSQFAITSVLRGRRDLFRSAAGLRLSQKHINRMIPDLSRRLLAQEIEQQRDDLLRLLLLNPVPGAVEQRQPGAGSCPAAD